VHLSHRLRSSCWLEGAHGAKRFARREKDFKQTLCADIDRLSLHAAVHCDADDLQALEQLCRYITRPALAQFMRQQVGWRHFGSQICECQVD